MPLNFGNRRHEEDDVDDSRTARRLERKRRDRMAGNGTSRVHNNESQSLLDKVMKTRKEIDERRNQYFKPEQGINRIRIMPSWLGDGEIFYKEFATHYAVGPEKKSATCLQYWGQVCPVCQAIETLSKSRNPRDLQLASDMGVRNRFMLNVAASNVSDATIKVWTISENAMHEILAFFGDPDYGDFTDPKNGYDYVFTCKGTGLKTRYTGKRFAKNATRIKVKNWREKLNNLDQFLQPLTRRQLRAMLVGEEEEDD